MFIECPICGSDQEESGFLFEESMKSQEERVFLFKESVKSPHRLDCMVYQNFLNIVSSKTNLTTTMVDILYFNNKLDDVVNIKDTWNVSINTMETKIPDNIVFNDNYEKSLGFVFANIIQLNKQYDISLTFKDYSEQYDLDLLNKENKYNIKLSISKSTYKKEDTEILLLIEFKKEDCIPYDINLLSKEEKENLFAKINNDRETLFKQKNKGLFSFNLLYNQKEDKLFFRSNFNFNRNEEIDSIYINMDKKIEEFYNEIIEIYESFKKENKCFFERALLEIELQDF